MINIHGTIYTLIDIDIVIFMLYYMYIYLCIYLDIIKKTTHYIDIVFIYDRY